MNRAVLTPIAFILGLMVAWQALVAGFGIPEYLLPSPSIIIATVERSLLVEIAYTAGEALCGFLIASALAFVAAVLFVRFRTVEQGLFPLPQLPRPTSTTCFARCEPSRRRSSVSCGCLIAFRISSRR